MTRNDIDGLVLGLEKLRREVTKNTVRFGELETFCLFVGYPKSGHSLIGALLNAHPDMVIAHELNSLRCLGVGLTRESILSLILAMATDFHESGHAWNGHDYYVRNQWQGRIRRLRVIGDKKGGGTSQLLARFPGLLDRLYNTIGLPIKFIHVVRDPWENIAGISRVLSISMGDALNLYFSMADAVAALKIRIPEGSLYEVYYEDFTAEPGWHLREICKFLGQEATQDYLGDCASLVRPASSGIDTKLRWTVPLLERARYKALQYDFLSAYSF